MSDAQERDDAAGTAVNTPANEDVDVEANVEVALREFLDVLGESETYRRFVAADEALRDDADAMALLQKYQQKQQQLERGGFDESVLEDLKELKSELSDNETIQRQQAAQAELVELLQRTNDVISETIGEEFARSTGGGCC